MVEMPGTSANTAASTSSSYLRLTGESEESLCQLSGEAVAPRTRANTADSTSSSYLRLTGESEESLCQLSGEAVAPRTSANTAASTSSSYLRLTVGDESLAESPAPLPQTNIPQSIPTASSSSSSSAEEFAVDRILGKKTRMGLSTTKSNGRGT